MGKTVSMLQLRQALEASWDSKTAYLGASRDGNPALGSCYPTSRVVQYYFPKTEIVEGKIQTNAREEKHFWNILVEDGFEYHIDLSWQQFPSGSYVMSWKIRDRKTLGDGEATIRRVSLLLERVRQFLEK
ncbi:MAG TPA: hypothetical protein VMB52_05295 [Verrucomicrobiae bacterium]|nr:hypothetical protein [Verrucomicrobiae bacterium]